MISSTVRRVTCAVALAATLLSHPAAALAEEPGVDPAFEADVLSAFEAAEKSAEMPPAAETDATPLRVDVLPPSRYLYTPTHNQQRSYWCGPASCQIVDDYFGTYAAQSTYAAFMDTTSAGTVFSRVDDCLRQYSGKPYYYHAALPSKTEVYNQIGWSIGDRGRPVVALVRIYGSTWPRYVYDHSGHIVPVEAFDYRTDKNLFRLNDPYDERDWRSGGGATGGHMTYSKSVLAGGVMAHPRRALVW